MAAIAEALEKLQEVAPALRERMKKRELGPVEATLEQYVGLVPWDVSDIEDEQTVPLTVHHPQRLLRVRILALHAQLLGTRVVMAQQSRSILNRLTHSELARAVQTAIAELRHAFDEYYRVSAGLLTQREAYERLLTSEEHAALVETQQLVQDALEDINLERQRVALIAMQLAAEDAERQEEVVAAARSFRDGDTTASSARLTTVNELRRRLVEIITDRTLDATAENTLEQTIVNRGVDMATKLRAAAARAITRVLDREA